MHNASAAINRQQVVAGLQPCALAEATGGTFGLPHEQEDIRTHVVPLATALEWVDAGRIVAASGLVPLLWLRGHLDQVRATWAADP